MVDLQQLNPELPWQYNNGSQMYYVYLPATDELLLTDGTRVRRPVQLERRMMASATVPPHKLQSISGLADMSMLSRVPRTYPGAQYTERTSFPGSYDEQSSTSPPSFIRSASSENDKSLAAQVANLRLAPGNTVTPRFTRGGDGLIAPIRIQRGSDPQPDSPYSQRNNTTIAGAEVVGASTESLFPGFKVRPVSFFFVGKVFMLLWSETAGSTVSAVASTAVTDREQAVVEGPHGERIYSKVRRFVVIRSAQGYCTALPISTYGRRGVGKPGVNKSEHAIIYTNPAPKPLPAEQAKRGEEPMRPTMIRMHPDTLAEKLDPLSRLNFGHIHTIQFNVKVKSCGKIADESLPPLLATFANVFDSGSRPLPASSPGPGRNHRLSTTSTDDKVQAALTALIDQGTSRATALRKIAESLRSNGVDDDEIRDIVRRALH